MWGIIVSVVATMVGMTGLGGLAIRYALVPYMSSQLVDPIRVDLASIINLANEAVMQVQVIVRAYDGNQEWTQREVDRLWERLLINERVSLRQRTAGQGE